MTVTAELISKRYKPRKGGREINVINESGITVKGGELAVISERSGSGKTTLLSVLAGLVRPESGSVHYDNDDIFSMNDAKLSRYRNKSIGYIPQGHGALSALTVLENLILPAALDGRNEQQRAEQLLERLGLSELKNQYPRELSGGELRRLAIARALINSPAVILADEPTNDLDDENTGVVLQLLKEQAQQGAAVVIVSHEQAAASYADTTYKMESGRLYREGV